MDVVVHTRGGRSPLLSREMVMATFTTKRIAVATAALVVLGAGGIAYWTACGSGTGTASTGGAGWTVPGSESLSVTLTSALSMGTGAASACQGAAFPVYLTVAS
jgi:hypothetical protein